MADFWKNKKILVTGGNGFLGRHLVKKLIEKDVKKEDIFAPIFPECDLRKLEDCKKVVVNQDIVIHLAGVVGGIDYNEKYPGKVFYDNGSMALHMLETSRLAGVKKFVGMGTVCEYPKIIPMPFKEEDLWQGYPEETNAPYGLAKKFMLAQSQAYRKEYGFNAIHLLMQNLYGPGDNFSPESSHVIPALIKKVYEAKKENKDFIEAWGTGKATRQFIYVEDAAEAVILAAEKYDKPQPINIGSSREISIKELAELICKLMDFKGGIKWDLSKPDGQPRRFFDLGRAEKEIGFRANTSFEDGILNTINWYKNNATL
ncbi:MAG: GDP-L-fucose synthase [Patescibacteria group bacterium]